MNVQVMANRNFEPSEDCEKVLDILKDGRANPRLIINETDLKKSEIEYCLRRLTDAEWIDRPARGLYAFNVDPRGDETDE